MAIKTLFDENEDTNNPNKSTNLESGVIGGGAPVVAPGTAAKSTGWTNLQQYLDTNKGAGGAIADAQLGGLNKEIGTTKDSINSWASEANKNVNAGIRKDEWSGKVKGASADQINQNFGGQNAQAFDAWKSLNNYMGPKDATKDTGYQDAYSKSQNTWDKINNANSLEGQKQLAKDAFGKDASGNAKNYSTGMSALDSFVARGDAQGKFDAFQTGNANFNNTLKSNVSAVNSKIGGAEAIGAANKKSAMDAISQRLKELQDTGITAAQQKQAADIAGHKDYLKGITASNGQKMNDDQVNSMVSSGSYDPSDFYGDADLSAINTLAGLDDNDATNAISRAGTQTNARFDNTALDKWLADNRPVKPEAPATPSSGGDGSSKTIDILANPAGAAGDVVQSAVDGIPTSVDEVFAPTDPVSQAVNDALDRNGLGRLKPKNPFSDRNTKENVQPIDRNDILEFLTHVQPYFYTYIDQANGEGVHPGFMAQDLMKSKLGKTIVENQDGILTINGSSKELW